MTRFEYASKKKPISVSPLELKGPGWSANIEGNCKVSDLLRLSNCMLHGRVFIAPDCSD